MNYLYRSYNALLECVKNFSQNNNHIASLKFLLIESDLVVSDLVVNIYI
jgi:hypothetical protein